MIDGSYVSRRDPFHSEDIRLKILRLAPRDCYLINFENSLPVVHGFAR